MSNSLDLDRLTNRFVTRWAALGRTEPVGYDNAPPENRSGAWVRFSVRPGASERTSYTIGQTRILQLGRVVIQVFVPRGVGTALASEIADDAASIFRLWKSSEAELRTFEPELTVVPTRDDDEFFQINVSVRYESEHLY